MSKRTELERNMIEGILYWAKVIADAGYGHIRWTCPQVEHPGNSMRCQNEMPEMQE